jgi:hypothetical protein
VEKIRKFLNAFCSNLNALKALNIKQPLEDHIVTAACRTLGQSDTSRVAKETGRRRVPITLEINHINGAEISSFGNIKGFHQRC